MSATVDRAAPGFDEDAARARIRASEAFHASAQQWDRAIKSLDLPSSSPVSSELWARIEARLDAQPASLSTVTVRADDQAWEPLFEGVDRRSLYIDPEQRWEAVIVRMAPGSRFPGHGHSGVEECLVLEGEFEFGDLTVRKGDLHLAFPEVDHPEIYSRTGALLYIRAPLAA